MADSRWAADGGTGPVGGILSIASCTLGGLVFYYAIRRNLFPLPPGFTGLIPLAAVTALMMPVDYKAVSRGCRWVICGLAGLWASYAIARGAHVSSALTLNAAESFYYQHAPWAVLACAALTFWRPAFVVPVVILCFWQFQQTETSLGLRVLTRVDFYVALELPVFLMCLLTANWAWLRVVKRAIKTAADRIPTSDMLLLCALSIHLGNYLYAGVAKVLLDAPWTWLLENPTHHLIIGSIAQGISPLGLVPAVADLVYRTSAALVLPMNGWVLGIQLLAPLAVLRKQLLIWALVCYDVLHVGIFLLTGIFFWKWIVLNVLAIVAVSSMRVYPRGWGERGLLVGLVIASTLVFNITWLGWFDSRAVNVVSIHAELDDGRLARVPSSYFEAHSFNFAAPWHAQIGPDFYPTQTIGQTLEAESFRRARRCEDSNRSTIVPLEFAEEALAFIAAHHQRVLADYDGAYHFDVYPHHIFSWPSYFADFYTVDPRRIESYVVRLEARCLSLVDGVPVGGTRTVGEVRVAVGSTAGDDQDAPDDHADADTA